VVRPGASGASVPAIARSVAPSAPSAAVRLAGVSWLWMRVSFFLDNWVDLKFNKMN